MDCVTFWVWWTVRELLLFLLQGVGGRYIKGGNYPLTLGWWGVELLFYLLKKLLQNISWPTLIRNIQEKKLTFCSAQLGWYISKSPHTSSDHGLQQKENWLSDLETWLCEFGQNSPTFLSGVQVLIFSCRIRTVAWTLSILKSLLAVRLYFCHLISYLC